MIKYYKFSQRNHAISYDVVVVEELETALINLIIDSSHPHHKSALSENKYIDDSISKGYVLISSSSTDKRKKVLIPSEKMILELKQWLLKIAIF